MTGVSTYLNFVYQTEEALLFYPSIFGREFVGGFNRFSEMPPAEGMPPLQEKDKNLILQMAFPILGDPVLMGSDAPESMDFHLRFGNTLHINLETDLREETERLFHELSTEGKLIQA